MSIETFAYRVNWRSTTSFSDNQHSLGSGGQKKLCGYKAPLFPGVDYRNRDVRASLLHPMQQTVLRQYTQSSRIRVHTLLDLTASCGYEGTNSKPAIIRQLTQSIAASAWLHNDSFALWAADDSIREQFCAPLQSRHALETRILTLLQHPQSYRNREANGILDIAKRMGNQRALVFLVSDFFWPLTLLDAVLNQLSRHDVVCIRVMDSAETLQHLPNWRFANLFDPETQQRRRLLIRPELKLQLQQANTEYHTMIDTSMARHNRKPVNMTDTADLHALTRHFYPDL